MKRTILLIASFSFYGLLLADPGDTTNNPLFLGTNSSFNYNFSTGGNANLSYRLGIAGQYQLNEKVNVGASLGFRGGRYAFGEDEQMISGNREFFINPNITYYPPSCMDPCYRVFIRVDLGYSRGQSRYRYANEEPRITPIQDINLGFSPGVTFHLKEGRILNLFAPILSLNASSTRGTSGEGSTQIHGGINSGLGIELLCPFD